MGNQESKIYEITVKHILYENGYIKPNTDKYYYIEKSWYDQFCEYVEKKNIEEHIKKKLCFGKYNKIELNNFKMSDKYSFNKEKKPPKQFNLQVHIIELMR